VQNIQAGTMQAQIDLSELSRDDGPPPDELAEQAAHLFRVHGALLIKNVFPVELIRQLHANFHAEYECLPMEEVAEKCLEVGHQRYMFTVKLQAPFNNPQLFASKRIMPIITRLLGKDCVIQSLGAVCAFPGAEMQHQHIDHPLLFKEVAGVNAFLPPYALHLVVPMVNLNDECGTTAIWEGSHRKLDRNFREKFVQTGPDTLKGASLPYPQMGDCYLMDFRLTHRGTANCSDKPRTILYVVYSRCWFQDHQNFSKQARLDIHPEEYRKIPAENQHLFINLKLR